MNPFLVEMMIGGQGTSFRPLDLRPGQRFDGGLDLGKRAHANHRSHNLPRLAKT